MAKKNHDYKGLREGETLVWTGAPCVYKDYGKMDRVLLPVSYVILAISTFFAMFWGFSIARSGFHAWHILSLILLLVVGGLSVYAVFFRFIFKRRRKTDFAYGVTSQRRVLICDHKEDRTYAFEAGECASAAVTEADQQGTGTIYLQPKRAGNFLDNSGLEFLSPSDGCHNALFDIPNCKKILKLMKSDGKRAQEKSES